MQPVESWAGCPDPELSVPGCTETVRVGISDLDVKADIGIKPDEIGVPQVVIVDISAELSVAVTDDIGSTLDYRTIAEIVDRIASERTGLIEVFARKIAKQVIAQHPVEALKIRVRKPRALGRGTAEAELEWRAARSRSGGCA